MGCGRTRRLADGGISLSVLVKASVLSLRLSILRCGKGLFSVVDSATHFAPFQGLLDHYTSNHGGTELASDPCSGTIDVSKAMDGTVLKCLDPQFPLTSGPHWKLEGKPYANAS